MKTKPMNKSERRRIEIIKSEMGCEACLQDEIESIPCHAHHIVICGSRVGHLATYGLCDDHHVGNEMSVHKTKRKFNKRYGTDGELLTKCNERIRDFEAMTVR